MNKLKCIFFVAVLYVCQISAIQIKTENPITNVSIRITDPENKTIRNDDSTADSVVIVLKSNEETEYDEHGEPGNVEENEHGDDETGDEINQKHCKECVSTCRKRSKLNVFQQSFCRLHCAKWMCPPGYVSNEKHICMLKKYC